MSNITQFPIPSETISQISPAINANLTDVFPVSQISGSVYVTALETLQQVLTLFLPNLFLSYAGNPNGHVAGTAFQVCYDTTDQLLYVCTVTGNAMSAVWRPSIQSGGILPVDVTGGSAQMVSNRSYIADNAAIKTTLTLPVNSNYGDFIYVSGRQQGWIIAQNANQQIFVSPSHTTSGTGGSLASTNVNDSIILFCTQNNLQWNVISQQSAGITIV
jgi:hypothetical protein